MGVMMSKRFQEKKKEMFEAAKTGLLEPLKEIVNSVDDEEEKIELINCEDSWGGTILHAATAYGRIHVVRWILSEQGGRAAGFDSVLAVSEPDEQTALHVAAQEGYLEVCKAIVNGCLAENGEREGMLNAANNKGLTVLHCAVDSNHLEIVKWLLSEAEGGGRALGFHNILAKAMGERTALHFARGLETFLAVVDGCRADNGERQEMLNAVDDFGWTILHHAAYQTQLHLITWLLSDDGGGAAAGFDRSLITALTKKESRSILHLAAGLNAECSKTLLSNCNQEERMNLFLAVDENGWSALCYAARNNRPDCIATLFQFPESGLIANRKDKLGMTVLHRAIIGGINEQSRKEWHYNFRRYPASIAALLGSSETGWTSIDPNIGLGLE